MSDYLINKLRKEVERCKNAGGMRAGLPTVKVDLYELERVLDMADERDVLQETIEHVMQGRFKIETDVTGSKTLTTWEVSRG